MLFKDDANRYECLLSVVDYRKRWSVSGTILEKETGAPGENLSLWLLVHHRSYMDWPSIEAGLPAELRHLTL